MPAVFSDLFSPAGKVLMSSEACVTRTTQVCYQVQGRACAFVFLDLSEAGISGERSVSNRSAAKKG